MDIDINRIFEITNEFLDIPSVVGYEKPFLDYMNQRAKKLEYKTIQKENYLVMKSNKKTKILFSAHIDRQGLVLNDVGQVEYATNYLKKRLNLSFRREEQEEREKNLKELLGNSLNDVQVFLDDFFLRFKSSSGSLNFFRQDGPNDIEKMALRYVREAITSYDILTGEKFNEFKTIRYDLDWKNHSAFYKLNKKLLKNDKVFMLNSSISKFEDKFSGQIDNVISAAVLFYLLEQEDFNADIIFTCGEEMGMSYKSIIDYYLDYNIDDMKLLVLDTSPYPDFIGKEEGFLVLRYGDERNGFNLNLVEEIKAYLVSEKISFDFKPSFLGRTELGKVAIESNGKINGCTLQLPSLNYHTTYETSTIKSLKNYLRVIRKLSN